MATLKRKPRTKEEKESWPWHCALCGDNCMDADADDYTKARAELKAKQKRGKA